MKVLEVEKMRDLINYMEENGIESTIEHFADNNSTIFIRMRLLIPKEHKKA